MKADNDHEHDHVHVNVDVDVVAHVLVIDCGCLGSWRAEGPSLIVTRKTSVNDRD